MSAVAGDELMGPVSDKSDEEVVDLSRSLKSGSQDAVQAVSIRRRSGRPAVGSKSKNVKAKLEGSRRSARECRARRKLRYQYLEEMVTNRERAILSLRRDLEKCKKLCMDLDDGKIPKALINALTLKNEDS